MNTNLELIYQALEDIARATRQKLGETDKYTLMEIPEKIRSISGGGVGSSLWSLKSYPSNWMVTPHTNYSITGMFYHKTIPSPSHDDIVVDTSLDIGTTDWRQITVTPT